MVQNKQKSNKINIAALITCFMLVVVFVFGCVQFTFAASRKSIDELLSSYSGNSSNFLGVEYGNQYSSIYCLQSFSGRICAVVETNGNNLNFGFVSDNPFTLEQYTQDGYTYTYSYDRKDRDGFYKLYSSTNTLNDYKSSILTFGSFSDAYNYIQTGEVNNPIYDNRPIEYDESVELPLSAQCQVNGDLFLFNCKQSVAHSDYTIQLSADCRLTPVYSNFASKSYADTKQSYRTNKNEIGKYDNHGISFNTSFSTTDLLNGVDTSRKALGFKEFYNGIYINLPYEKCTLSEIVFYARNICGNKCSNWVRVTYDLVNETSKYEEIESVTGSNVPSDTKHNNSEYYPDDYLYNDDEAFNSGSNITNTLTNLKTNYASLVNFYKDLFSFLPGEVWALLIGLVGAMVILALVFFIRG